MHALSTVGVLLAMGLAACQPTSVAAGRGAPLTPNQGPSLAPPVAPPQVADAPPAADAPDAISLQRVAVLGASMSGGFASDSVSSRLTRGLNRDHQIVDFSDITLFRDPQDGLRKQVEAAVAFSPTDTFALDVLFWLAYGTRHQETRRRRIQTGLIALDALDGRLYLGDIPLVASAKRWVISEVPSEQQLDELNHDLQTWADARNNVELIPISVWAKPLATGSPIVTEPGAPPRDATEFLFIDGLHPNDHGMDYLLSRTWRHLVDKYPGTTLHPF